LKTVAVILIPSSQAYEFKERNASPKLGKKHTHFDPDFSPTEADMTVSPLLAKATPTSSTILQSKTHVRKQIIPIRSLAESSTNSPPSTYQSSTTATKPNDGKLSKASRIVPVYLPERKNTINDLAFARNLSRNLRESAPSPEPSPPLGMKEKGARSVVKNAAASSMVSTALNKRSRALTSKKEAKQHTEDVTAKSTWSKCKLDIARPLAANKIMTAKTFPKAKHGPKVAESGVTETKDSEQKATPVVTKSNIYPKAAAPMTRQTIDTQPTTIVPSNSKPKKRLGH